MSIPNSLDSFILSTLVVGVASCRYSLPRSKIPALVSVADDNQPKIQSWFDSKLDHLNRSIHALPVGLNEGDYDTAVRMSLIEIFLCVASSLLVFSLF